MVMGTVRTNMESPKIQRFRIEDAADTLAHQEGVDEAKAELERIAQKLDQ